MKLCPFLVAGQSMQSLQPRPDVIPVTPFIETAGEPPADAGTPVVVASDEGGAAPLPSLECLGSPCRFFHAGGCRFDALFDAQTQALAAISSAAATAGGRAEAGVTAGSTAALASIPNLLEEVWTLQRESLREVLGGFRKLEAAQAGVATQVESSVASRVENLIGGVATQVGAFQSAVARLQGDLEALRGQVVTSTARPAGEACAAVGPEIIDLVGRHFETLERDVRQIETAVRAGLGDSLRTFVRESQSAAKTGAETSLRAVLEGVQAAVRTASAESQAVLRGLVQQSQTGDVGKLTAELQSIRDVRIQIQAALDGLTRETREMASVARRVESSQVLTHELLDEQRQVHQKVDAREKRDRARQLNNAGVASYHQGAYDTSVQRFKEATELDPTLGEAYNNLGLSYTEMGREEEAIVAFQRAIELDPTSGSVYNNLGYLYYRKGDLDHAIEMYQRAIQRGADTSAAYCNLGNAHYRLKRIDAAVQAWRRALEVDPANAKAAAALERLGLESRQK